ncbi:ABC transporter ATP-binding protein [Aeromicrobium sp. Sec7.5]|uniref:ABC transporter ATP-binding protein n=1 Tax=Aeromicrobium sp. Sec7.5 TaxID=3121276 RepID=UPI002FE469EB
MTALDNLGGTNTTDLTRRGFGVLGVGIGRQKALFSLSIAFSVLFGATTVADAWVLGWATDHVIRPSFADGDVATGALVTGTLLFISAALLRMIGVVGRRLVGGIVYYRLVAGDRRRVTRKYLQLPVSWHQSHPTGQLLSNANADVEAIWSVFMPLPMAIGVIAMLIVAVVTMLAADPVLTLVGLVVFPLLFVLNVVYQRRQGPRMAQAQSLRGDVSSVAHESFDGALVVKSLGREDEETARFAAASEELRDANIAVGRVRAVFEPVLEALPSIGVLLVVLLGIGRIESGATEPGDVVQIAYLFTIVAMPVRAIGWVLAELPRTVVGWDRVRGVLDDPTRFPYGSADLPGSGPVGLRTEGLGFSYEPDELVLAGLDLEVQAGSVTAVVGSTGSGKSTLASLVTRLVDADEGRVLLDGRAVAEVDHEALSAAVSLVAQATFLFDDTVRSNITLDADIDDETVWDVLRTVQADRFVSALPHGLDTELGERGTSLSGGQRQRLSLARALVRAPRLLVLDDATSALDPDVEQRILRALAERSQAGGPTVLVVAYRKATIALADQVVHLADGRIADRGTHAELRERSAAYRDLVDAYDQARQEVDHE